jgi:hypothetical protein
VKYEDPFGGKGSVYPFFSGNDDPYEASKDELLRAKWLKDNKILSGDFKPAFADKCIERVNRSQLPDIVNYLKKIIMIDWAEVNFIIGSKRT